MKDRHASHQASLPQGSRNPTVPGFVHPSCRPGHSGSGSRAGAIPACLLFVAALLLFKFGGESSWFQVGGGLCAGGGLALSWRSRGCLPRRRDLDKLYGRSR